MFERGDTQAAIFGSVDGECMIWYTAMIICWCFLGGMQGKASGRLPTYVMLISVVSQ